MRTAIWPSNLTSGHVLEGTGSGDPNRASRTHLRSQRRCEQGRRAPTARGPSRARGKQCMVHTRRGIVFHFKKGGQSEARCHLNELKDITLDGKRQARRTNTM